ncbi:MAG: UbiA family prenyltransferase [Nitrospira sp.]|nr:UbiA family prenyltransferase [Nitrospira sp.]
MTTQGDQCHSGDSRLLPLVVDLDGTLTPTDTLIESILQLVKQSPLNLLRLPFWLLAGRAGFKNSVAAHTCISWEHLPYAESLLFYLRAERTRGRRIVLATAAHKSIAEVVARHLGIFDEVLATEGGTNLKGQAKLRAIQKTIGGQFVYAGDSRADIPIWKVATAAILVRVNPRTALVVRRAVLIEHEFPGERAGLAVWLRAMRIHQWLKNLLLFVPLMTSFSLLETGKLATMSVAFLSFSFAASAGYILNDLLDLESDRAHPRKRFRPFASATLSIFPGLAVAGGALVLALCMALAVSQGFLLMLLFYLVLTCAYSWGFKELVLLDVLILSLLYTVRILAGSVAVGIATSSWLLAFSVFIFLSLALVKRCAELVSLQQDGRQCARGRDYRATDLRVLWPLGVGAALSAVVVFGLFISAPETQARYASPHLLWLAAIGLIYWLARIWVKTSRGEMHDDPVIYVFKDSTSLLTMACLIIVMLIAHFITVVGIS